MDITRTMRSKILGWLLLSLLCSRSLLISVSGQLSASTRTQDEEPRGVRMTEGLSEDPPATTDLKQGILSVSRKGGKGKGAYGGANVVHRPPKASSTASCLVSPLFVVSVLTLVSFGFIST